MADVEARDGLLDQADHHFVSALAFDPLDSRVAFGRGFVAAARSILGVLEELDRLYVGDLTAEDFDHHLKTIVRAELHEAAYHIGPVDRDDELAFYLDRLLILENGTSIGIGTVDWDLGEGLAIRGVLKIASGALGVMDEMDIAFPTDLFGLKSFADYVSGGDLENDIKSGKGRGNGRLVESLRELADGLDDLAWALNHVMGETDDQSDDLITRDLVQLQGEFVIPGVMVPVPVVDLLSGALGIEPEQIEQMEMPKDAIHLLRIFQGICLTLADLAG